MSSIKARRASSGSIALRGHESAIQKQTIGPLLAWLASQPSSLLSTIPSITPPPEGDGFKEWARAVVSLLTWAIETDHEITVPVAPSKIRPITTKVVPLTKPIASSGLAAPVEVVVPVEPKPSLKEPRVITGDVPIVHEEKPTTKIAYQVLDIIQKYGQHLKSEADSNQGPWLGRAKFSPKVEKYVEANQPIEMILPSFPWKSINRVDKVTGALPDLGEELALARLNNLCEDIGKIYEHGARVTIATDGLVFNDVVMISDDDTWDYSVSLMDMAAKKGYNSIKLVRAMELLGMTRKGEVLTKDRYMELVGECRKLLAKQFTNPDKAVREMIENDPDTLLTYRGFIRFLEADLKFSPIAQKATSGRNYRAMVKQVAMKMMERAESFTKLIQATCPDYVRLSIHPSSGQVKLSIPLIPQSTGAFPRSPWHSSIAVGVDGSYRTVHSKEVRETHNLIHRHGRPYFYREKSELFDWTNEEGKVEFEHLYGGGCVVTPIMADAERKILTREGLLKLKKLAALQSPVIAKGFANRADGEIVS